MTPYHSTRPRNAAKSRHDNFRHPLEDPLNHEDQRDFVFLMERWTGAKRGLARILKR